MKNLWKEFLFLLSWGISRLLTEIICDPLLNGFVGNIVCFIKELIYDYTLLHFLFITFYRSLSNALMCEQRVFQREVYNKQVTVTVLGNDINFLAETVNRSQGGMMVVLSNHMRKFTKKGIILSVENELYRIVWGHSKGMQWQIGLQRQ
jgi:hypothetical protein